ncbi:MAG: thioredoxin family protein [Phycicoccus sp.]|nr:thioredoxin family protein [Phycicoccus sp.]NMM34740.1 thioredoxin family protein [Phycicoccus sp.]
MPHHESTVVRVTDYPTIVGYGVMSTPGTRRRRDPRPSGRVPCSSQV